MPNIDLDSFKANLLDICRPNRFKVSIQLDFSTEIEFSDEDYYFVKACSIPGKTLGEIDLNYMGYKYKIAGDPSFNDVTITFLNEIPRDDGVMSVRERFVKWFNIVSEDTTNLREVHEKYKATVTIVQLDGQGEELRSYYLINAHPKELSDIELSMESNDTVEEFTVVFSFSYFTTDISY